MTAYAFQCLDCGHLEVGAHAGDNLVPVNCRHCDIGSHMGTDAFGNPVQIVDRANDWAVLADLTDKEQADALAAHANPGDTIKRYTPPVAAS